MRRAAAILLLALLGGCYHVRYVRPSQVPEGGAAREQWHHGALGGTIDLSGPVDLAAACPGGFARVESEVGFVYWLARAFSSLAANDAESEMACGNDTSPRRGRSIV